MPVLLDDGGQCLWDVQLADLLETEQADLRRLDGDPVARETRLPDDTLRTSVITLTDRHILGTNTRLTASAQALLSIELPATDAPIVGGVRRVVEPADGGQRQ